MSDSEDNEQGQPASSPPRPRRRAAAAVSYKEVDDNASFAASSSEDNESIMMKREEDEDEDAMISDSEEDSKPPAAAKKKTRKKRKTRSAPAPAASRKKERSKRGKTEQHNEDDDGDDNRVCPHCQKKFATPAGCLYHVQHFVCQPDKQQAGQARKPRSKTGQGAQQFPRLRGKLADRTCPTCRRVFTSKLGKNYHVERKVCEAPSKQSRVACATLPPGQTFATKFGILEVVRDNRATPTAQLPDDLPQQTRKYTNGLLKRDARIGKEVTNAAVQSRVRRALLQNAYQAGQHGTQPSVAAAYQIDAQPAVIKKLAARSPPPQQQRQPTDVLKDPAAPDGSFPDRIVECVLRPDRRPRLVGDGGDDGATAFEGLAEEAGSSMVVRMFVPRRLLTTVYTEDSLRYHCPHCWQSFLSKPGLKYHVDADSCTKRTARTVAAQTARLQSIDERAQELLGARQRGDWAAVQKQMAQLRSPSSLRGSASNAAAMAPAAAASEEDGFQQRSAGSFDDEEEEKIEPAASSVVIKKKVKRNVEDDLVNPDQIIDELEAEFHRLNGEMVGPMYPEVWKSLGFKKPRKKYKQRRKRKKGGTKDASKRSKTSTKAEAPSPPPPPPPPPPALGPCLAFMERGPPTRDPVPIIDTRILASEANVGRYPSIKRYEGEHDSSCAICKFDIPPYPVPGVDQAHYVLIPCNFCSQVVHFSCMKTKFIVKEPEVDDGDDFMCHKCMGYIVSRRARAEKRRRDKLNLDDKDGDSNKLAAATSEEARLREQRQLLHGAVPNREYESVAAQSRRVEDLSELLRDAKERLSLNVEMASMNQIRRGLLDSLTDESV